MLLCMSVYPEQYRLPFLGGMSLLHPTHRIRNVESRNYRDPALRCRSMSSPAPIALASMDGSLTCGTSSCGAFASKGAGGYYQQARPVLEAGG